MIDLTPVRYDISVIYLECMISMKYLEFRKRFFLNKIACFITRKHNPM